jgi:hypothetical protein
MDQSKLHIYYHTVQLYRRRRLLFSFFKCGAKKALANLDRKTVKEFDHFGVVLAPGIYDDWWPLSRSFRKAIAGNEEKLGVHGVLYRKAGVSDNTPSRLRGFSTTPRENCEHF